MIRAMTWFSKALRTLAYVEQRGRMGRSEQFDRVLQTIAGADLEPVEEDRLPDGRVVISAGPADFNRRMLLVPRICRGRMDATADPQTARSYNRGVVDLERNNRTTSSMRAPDDARAIDAPTEMARPTLLAGIEEWRELSAHRIIGADTLPFL